MKEMDKFYNEQQKNRFLDTIDKSKFPPYYWDRLFASYKKSEEECGKDLCNFTRQEIFNAHKEQNYRSFETLIIGHINLKNYTDWAIQQSLVDDGENHYDEFITEELFDCVNTLQLKQSIITRDLLERGISKLDNPQDSFLLIGIFEGVKGKEFIDLTTIKMSDIDLDNKTVRLPSINTVIPVSNTFINWAIKANSQDKYYRRDGREYPLYGDNIIKLSGRYAEQNYMTGNKQSASTYRAILRSLDEMGYGKTISCNSLYTSGIIDLINTIAKEHGVNAEKVLYDQELYNLVLLKYNLPASSRRRFLIKFGDFLIK